jgi:hypothetical protein
MSIEQTPRFRYLLGLNQPAASPTVKRLTQMAQAIGEETGGEFLVEVMKPVLQAMAEGMDAVLRQLAPDLVAKRPVSEAPAGRSRATSLRLSAQRPVMCRSVRCTTR